MQSLFSSLSHQSILNRIDKLKPDTKPLWGKMDAAQMLAHASIPIEAALGEKKIPGKWNFLLRLFFKSVLYSDKPYSKNSPTNKHFIISDKRNFEFEKNHLLSIIDKAFQKGQNGNWGNHPTLANSPISNFDKVFTSI